MHNRFFRAALIAAALTTATATTGVATAAPPVETPALSMADIYDPQASDIYFRKVDLDYASSYIVSDAPLPEGTTFELLDANVTDTLADYNGIIYSLNARTYTPNTYAEIFTYQKHINPIFIDGGNTTTARVLVHYPDGSQDLLEIQITIVPTLEQVKPVSYPNVTMTYGEEGVSIPTISSPHAAGTRFTLENKSDLIRQGWTLNLDSDTGVITASAPHPNTTARLRIQARYPDGTAQYFSVVFTVREEQQPDETPPPPPKYSPGSSSS